MEMKGLIKAQDILKRLISQKQSPYRHCTVRASKRSFLEQEDWEFVPSKLRKSIRMRKPKSHNDALEDRVWALLAKMRFGHMNRDNQFQLQYAPELAKKIDVIAVDEEAILIVECKSSAERKKVSYQKDINELIGIKDGLRRTAQKLVVGKPRVAFLFATCNALLTENDRIRLREGGIFHLNEAGMEYWERLVNHLGPAARYQLFGKLFAGQDIPNLLNRIPAIRGKVPSGHTFYSFSINPEFLLKMGFVLHRTETDIEASEAYQRLLNRTRLRDIGRYIDKGGYFPNSIIINIETKRKRDLRFDQLSTADHDSDTSLGILHLPRTYRSAFIVDGQHRLYGYSKATSQSHHTVHVVALLNLPSREQARIFVDINHTQKSVPTNLLRSIMADFNWASDDARQAISALKTRLLRRLNYDESSPLYKRIVLAEETSTTTRCLTLETLLKWGLSNKSGFFGRVKGKKLIKTGYLTEVDYSETLAKSEAFFKCCFDYMADHLQDQWNAGNGAGGFISMNIGISSIMRTVDRILDHLVKFDGIRVEDLSGQQLADKVLPYLLPVVEFVKNLDSDALKKLRTYFGSGAPDKVTMEFLNTIHTTFDQFNPEGLEQWIKEHRGEFNHPSWELGHERIEPLIHDFIIIQLKKEYGEKAWWSDGVPRTIQKDCSDGRIDTGSTEPDWNFLNTIHYRSIIDKNRTLLVDYFTPPKMENANREKKLSWLIKLNAVRQRYSHPQRDVITEEEYNFLRDLYSWLKLKLVI